MANYKKKTCTGQRRSSCHLCKPWKVRLRSRNSGGWDGFESISNHKRRIAAETE